MIVYILLSSNSIKFPIINKYSNGGRKFYSEIDFTRILTKGVANSSSGSTTRRLHNLAVDSTYRWRIIHLYFTPNHNSACGGA